MVKKMFVGMSTSYWHGWLLMNLSKNSLGGSMGNNPMCLYKMKYVNKVQELCGKIEIGEG